MVQRASHRISTLPGHAASIHNAHQSQHEAMVGYQNHGPGNVSERSAVSLVSEQHVLPINQIDLLERYFTVGHITPQEAFGWSLSEKDEAMSETAAVLVHWDEQSPAVICVLKDVAHQKDIPILALGPPSEAAQVAALIVGADDALTYPVSPVLLQAKLFAYHRFATLRPVPAEPGGDGMSRTTLPEASLHFPETHEVCTVGPLTLDRTARRFFVCGQVVALRPKEFDLMAFLMQRVGICLTRDDLLDQVWGLDFDPETSVLGTQVYTLRRKLAVYGVGDLIETVRGIGYRLVDEPVVKAASHWVATLRGRVFLEHCRACRGAPAHRPPARADRPSLLDIRGNGGFLYRCFHLFVMQR